MFCYFRFSMTAERSSSSLSVERGKEAEVVEVGEEDEVEDISDERYAKMHSKGERLAEKVNSKQEQSARWQLRSKREMGKKKVDQQNPGELPVKRLGPDPKDATHISVEEEEPPVSIFGRILPTVQDSSPFQLPWINDSSAKNK